MTYILYNPHANNGKGTQGVEAVRAALAAEAPILRDLTATDAPAFLGSLHPEDRVILCGGDGTVNRLINDLKGTAPAVPIHIWRFGTGNDFLNDVAGGARTVLLNDYMKNLPWVEVNGSRCCFLNGCCGGVDALVCQHMNEARGKKPSYAGIAVRSFFREFRTTSARVTVDGQTREYDRVWMAGAMNGRYQGGGMLFAPDQDRTSDHLSLFLWHGTSPLGTLLRFPTIMKGTHTRFTKHCVMGFCHEITVEFADPQYLQMDGETIPNVTRFTVTKRPPEERP